MTTYTALGRPVTREDGPDKVSGHHLYSADVILPGMAIGKVLRSPYPHARIVNIDVSRAEAMPGIHAVITGKDMTGMLLGRVLQDVPPLAVDKVRYVGRRLLR